MAQMAFSKSAANIMQQAKDIGFIGIHSGQESYLFRAMSCDPAVSAPGTRIAAFRFSQNLLCLFSVGITFSMIEISQFLLMIHNIGIPMNQCRQLGTWKLRTQATKLNLMFPAAAMNRASAGFCPFRHSTVCLDASFANPIPFFLATDTAFAACRNCRKIIEIHMHSFSF